MRPDQTIELTADHLDDAGAGVGQADGVQVHAANLLPGERGTVLVEHRSPHRQQAWGRCLERLGPDSQDRREPACPAFGSCGGCAWQHLDYPAQLLAKRERVVQALARALPAPLIVQDTVPAPAEFGYRNKGKYVVGLIDGVLSLGAYRPRSHDLVDTSGCHQVDPAVDRAAREVRQALASSALQPYDEATRAGVWRYVIARAGADGRVLVHLVTSTAATAAPLSEIADALVQRQPIAGVSWSAHDHTSGAILGGTVHQLAGASTIVESIAGVDLAIDATAFFQVNRAQALRVYQDLATATDAKAGIRAVDLYCGVGAISFALAAAGAQVHGIELAPQAVSVANAAATQNTRFTCAPAAELLSLVAPPIDLLTLNPPRKGLDPTARAAVIELAPTTIGYLSCGPESLARDLAHLIAAGYLVELVRPYDLMPGTAQIETLTVLRRHPATPPSPT